MANVFDTAKYINEYKNIAICNAPSKTFNLAGLCSSYIISLNSILIPNKIST